MTTLRLLLRSRAERVCNLVLPQPDALIIAGLKEGRRYAASIPPYSNTLARVGLFGVVFGPVAGMRTGPGR